MLELNFWEMENIDTEKYEQKEICFGSWKEADPDDWDGRYSNRSSNQI